VVVLASAELYANYLHFAPYR